MQLILTTWSGCKAQMCNLMLCCVYIINPQQHLQQTRHPTPTPDWILFDKATERLEGRYLTYHIPKYI